MSDEEFAGDTAVANSAAGAAGYVDVSNADRRVWLVKVPEFLADRLAELDEDGLDLGVVRIYEASANSPAKVKVHLNPTLPEPSSPIPLDYDLSFTRCEQPMHLFAEDDSGTALMIEGRVEQECHLRPELTDSYHQLLRTREYHLNQPRRTVVPLDSDGGARKHGLLPHTNDYRLERERRRKHTPDLRRERLPKRDALDLLFRAFERFPLWTLSGLVEHVQQPSAYVKELLADIAVYNQRGENKNLYELKAEYRSGIGRT